MSADRRFHPFRLLTRLEVALPVARPLTRRLARRRFDALAPTWDRIRGGHPDSTLALEAALHAIRAVDPRPPRRILDVGTGTGQAAFVLRDLFPDAEIDAIDTAPAMIETARAKPGADGIRFAVADGAHLPFPDATFDLVVLLCVQPFATELGRVVRPGGWVLFAYAMGPTTPIYFAPGTLASALRRAGFEPATHGRTGPGEWTVARRAPGRA
ncbi:MAG: hypothetical protein AVDCRST_MAG79-564 [uncultured Thermoleophilia bacterium]|uniref:Methyltransferase domain-containing protein n=1 Tax=uncultured Thermoleophilia bacterium TaxID=1497501 RepID=A0A6J4TLX8_9ACTN|nr:MAG: hypothetical protein AVDCRST_MAG79-564 [uncultured Thermoleophilia bacterium]